MGVCRRRVRALALALVGCTGLVGRVGAADLTSLSLEELMGLEVALVSRRPELVADVPAAIHVLTADDLRRTGARSLPEALRLVPGLQVGRIDASKWAVSVRGFNNQFANKLLVLVDGRSVYTPVFSGVFWDAQDMVLDDVERVEVIRGPGGTLWGANAVNGIINVVTRPAAETRGTHVRLGSGIAEPLGLAVRHGRHWGDNADARFYVKYFDRSASEDSTGRSLADDWSVLRTGARLDWRPQIGDLVSLDAGYFEGDIGETIRLVTGLTPPYVTTSRAAGRIAGGHLLGRWERDLDDEAKLALQASYDHLYRRDGEALAGDMDILDLDFQHRQRVGNHGASWGLGYRRTDDQVMGSFAVTFTPTRRTTHLLSAFAHADLSLRPDRLGLATGVKLERNSHTGLELQPSTRLWWAPTTGHLLWGAVSRAVRTPSRSDDDLAVAVRVTPVEVAPDSILPTLITQIGDPGIESEDLLAFEVGYRAQLGSDWLVDGTAFYNVYDDLRTAEPTLPTLRDEPGQPAHFYLPVSAANRAGGTTLGLETTTTWQLADRWRLAGGYSLLAMHLTVDDGSLDELVLTQEQENPVHQAHLRLQGDLPHHTELDLVGRFVDELPAQGIEPYLTLDARLGWHPRQGLELAVGGRHLLASPHREFSPQLAVNVAGRVAADLYTTVAWQF